MESPSASSACRCSPPPIATWLPPTTASTTSAAAATTRNRKLLYYDLAKQKETAVGDCTGFELSADRKKMILSQEGTYAIIDLPKGKADIQETLNLSGLEVNLDRGAEWAQIFNECWRQMRDFFYAPNMHGVDWRGLRDRYAALLPHVSHRADLTYIIGEMIGELSAGHTYVGGGDLPAPRRIQTGLLGAELERIPFRAITGSKKYCADKTGTRAGARP